MELFFQYKDSKILNINDGVRKDIRKMYEEMSIYSKSNNEVIDAFQNKLLKMHELDKKSYFLYTQVMLADTYKMLLQLSTQNTLSEEKLLVLNTLRCMDITVETILNYYITAETAVFEEMIDSSVAFDKLNLLGRKTVVQNSRGYDKEISIISPYHALDILRYGQKTTTNEFIQYYNETLDLIVTESDILIENIISHMKHLYIFNRDNYIENVRDMCRVFYKWRKFNQCIGENEESEEISLYLHLLEVENIDHISQEFLFNGKFGFQVANDFCYYTSYGGQRIKNKYFSEEEVDGFIKDKIPASLKKNKIKK